MNLGTVLLTTFVFVGVISCQCNSYYAWDCSSLTNRLYNFSSVKHPLSSNPSTNTQGPKFWVDPLTSWSFWPKLLTAHGWQSSHYSDPDVVLKLLWKNVPEDFWHHFNPETNLVNRFPEAHHISDKLSHDKLIKAFFARTGCSWREMYPLSFDLHDDKECKQFVEACFEDAEAEKIWFFKPSGGRGGSGIRVLPTHAILPPDFYPVPSNIKERKDWVRAKTEYFCASPEISKDFLVQEAIEPLTLIHGARFHIRAYLLIVSTDPYIALFRNGFALRSFHPHVPYSRSGKAKVNPRTKSLPLNQYITHTKFQEKHPSYSYPDHWWTYDKLRKYYREQPELGDDKFLLLLDAIKKMTLTVSDTLLPNNPTSKGLYYFLSVDMMVKADGSLRLLEANNSPLLAVQPGMWEGRIAEDFRIMNEILHIVYTFHMDSKIPGKADPKSLVLSPEWDLLHDNFSEPERRYAPVRYCDKTEEKEDL